MLGFGLATWAYGVGTAPYAAAFYSLLALANHELGPLGLADVDPVECPYGMLTFSLYLLAHLESGRGTQSDQAVCALLIAANHALPCAILSAKVLLDDYDR